MTIPFIQSERLLLAPITMDELSLLHKVDSDSEVMRYLKAEYREKAADTDEWFEKILNDIKYEKRFMWTLKTKEDFVGTIGLHYVESEDAFFVEFRLLKNFWGQGYASEAIAQVLNFAEKKLFQKFIYAYYTMDNVESQEILVQCGFYHVADLPGGNGEEYSLFMREL